MDHLPHVFICGKIQLNSKLLVTDAIAKMHGLILMGSDACSMFLLLYYFFFESERETETRKQTKKKQKQEKKITILFICVCLLRITK